MKRFFSLLVICAGATSALAQAPAASPVAPDQPILPHSTNILEAMIAAGPVMLLLFLLSIFTVMLIIVYLFTIRRGAIVSSGYMATADALLRKRDYLGLLAVSNRHGEAVARIVQRTLDFMTKNPSADFAQAREIAETEGTRVATNLHNRVTYLADIATIGPLVGLFGTVIGIIRSFGALGSEAVGPSRYILLSKGISEALINTCGGLGVGITAMIFYAIFRGRAQRLVSDLESASSHLIALLSLQQTRRRDRVPALLEDEF
ncbi:MAG TPA: MotA/TolQ/ExbB proton channel family protein [Chthoniobacterales bacterium]|jgi:biopolymer transport protein ExbB